MDSNDIQLDENDEIAREILQQTQHWTVNDVDSRSEMETQETVTVKNGVI